jgi:hypothetical protein
MGEAKKKRERFDQSRNDNPLGGSELFRELFTPSPETQGVAKAIISGLSPPNPHVRAPIAIAALVLALDEAILANASPPMEWKKVIGKRVQMLAMKRPNQE